MVEVRLGDERRNASREMVDDSDGTDAACNDGVLSVLLISAFFTSCNDKTGTDCGFEGGGRLPRRAARSLCCS